MYGHDHLSRRTDLRRPEHVSRLRNLHRHVYVRRRCHLPRRLDLRGHEHVRRHRLVRHDPNLRFAKHLSGVCDVYRVDDLRRCGDVCR